MKPPWDGGNLVVTRLMGVLKASVPLFIDVTGKKLVEETIRTHHGVADAIEARTPPPFTMRCICTWSTTAT
jgi:hypothetical protein